jgi:hypothetical protein
VSNDLGGNGGAATPLAREKSAGVMG